MTARVGIVWRGKPGVPPPSWEENRLGGIARKLEQHGLMAVPVPFCEEEAERVLETMLTLNAVLVWVDPVVRGRDRSVLDNLLRQTAEQGIFVSTHPEVIPKMGTKEVLVRTNGTEFGTATILYRDIKEMQEHFPSQLLSGPRVIKRDRGSAGNAVWKVERTPGATGSLGATVAVLHGARGSRSERMPLRDFIESSRVLFEGGGVVVDQPFQHRLVEGMTRAYLVHDKVVGFGHQYVTALFTPPESEESPLPPPRYYYGAAKPEFQDLRKHLESGWVAEIQRLCGVNTESLPIIWDADFLLGPPDANGRDTYVLCEINVMGVFPIPDESLEPLAQAVVRKLSILKN